MVWISVDGLLIQEFFYCLRQHHIFQLTAARAKCLYIGRLPSAIIRSSSISSSGKERKTVMLLEGKSSRKDGPERLGSRKKIQGAKKFTRSIIQNVEELRDMRNRETAAVAERWWKTLFMPTLPYYCNWMERWPAGTEFSVHLVAHCKVHLFFNTDDQKKLWMQKNGHAELSYWKGPDWLTEFSCNGTCALFT